MCVCVCVFIKANRANVIPPAPLSYHDSILYYWMLSYRNFFLVFILIFICVDKYFLAEYLEYEFENNSRWINDSIFCYLNELNEMKELLKSCTKECPNVVGKSLVYIQIWKIEVVVKRLAYEHGARVKWKLTSPLLRKTHTCMSILSRDQRGLNLPRTNVIYCFVHAH